MGHSRFGRPRRALRRLGSLLAAGMLAGSQLLVPVTLVPVTQAAAIPTAAPPPRHLQRRRAILRLRVETPASGSPVGIKGEGRRRSRSTTGSWSRTTPATRRTTWARNRGRHSRSVTTRTTPGTPQSLGGDPAYPANCQWPAIHSAKGGTSAEVVAQGDETTLNETIPASIRRTRRPMTTTRTTAT